MENSQLLMLLGKLDGKVDAILNQIVQHSTRMDRLEEKHHALSMRVQTIENIDTASTTSKSRLWTYITSAGALLVSIAGLVKSLWFH